MAETIYRAVLKRWQRPYDACGFCNYKHVYFLNREDAEKQIEAWENDDENGFAVEIRVTRNAKKRYNLSDSDLMRGIGTDAYIEEVELHDASYIEHNENWI